MSTPHPSNNPERPRRSRLTDRQVAVLAAIERLGNPTLPDLRVEFPHLIPSAVWRVIESLQARGKVVVTGNHMWRYLGDTTGIAGVPQLPNHEIVRVSASSELAPPSAHRIAGAVASLLCAPVRFAAPFPGVSLPAGLVCPFAVSVTPLVDRGTLTVHFDKLGDVHWLHGSGNLLFRHSNDDTGAYVDLNVSGPGKLTFDADGTAHVDGQGAWSVFFLPTDNPSSTFLYIRGHLHLTATADGMLTLDSYTGTAENICDMLS